MPAWCARTCLPPWRKVAAVALISILWVAYGYSLAFVGDGSWIGTLDRWFLAG